MDRFLRGQKTPLRETLKHVGAEEKALRERIAEQQHQLASMKRLQELVAPYMTGPNACKTVGEALERLKQERQK